MRCLYREQRTLHGDYMDADVYPVFKDPTTVRSKKAKPSTETQELLNQANRERKLTWLMNNNLGPGGMKMELTYKEQPESDDRVMKDSTNVVAKMNRIRKSKGLPPMKRFTAIEKGKRNGRYHIHIAMDGGLTPQEIAKCWGKGYVTKLQPLQFTEFGLKGIAEYFVKSPICGKHWTASKNLTPYEQPRPNDYRFNSKRVRELALHKDEQDEFEKLYPGYYFAGCEIKGVSKQDENKAIENKYNGGIYLRIHMYKKTAKLSF